MAAALVWLENEDGGRHIVALFPLAMVAAAFLPWCVGEVRRLSVGTALLLFGLPFGAVLSIAFGMERSSFTLPALMFSTVIVAGLAAHRIWGRSWGPTVILFLLLIGFGMYWQRSFLQWWGSAGGPARWMALSWHNQSAAVMAALGMVFLGLAAMGRRSFVVIGLVGAGAALAGVWLSASRGGIVAAALVLAMMTVATTRARGVVRGMSIIATSLVVAVAVVGWLSFVRTDVAGELSRTAVLPTEQPLFERESSAVDNAKSRVRHMQAALGMFLDRPPTGQGLGSYRSVALLWSSSDANIPVNAHNRYVEVLGEGGLAMGAPFLGLVAGIGILVTRRLWRPGTPMGDGGPGLDDVRSVTLLGLAGAAAVVAIHSVVDFDWTFPVLPLMLSISAGVLTAERQQDYEYRTSLALSSATVAAVAVLLGVGVGTHLAERNQRALDLDAPSAELVEAYLPWQDDRAVRIALELSERGDHDAAMTILDDVQRWSPGRIALPTERAIVSYRAGEADADDVAETLDVGEDWFSSFNLAADVLIEGHDHGVAQRILTSAIDGHHVYPGWDRGIQEATSYALLARSLAETDGCNEARAVVIDAPAVLGLDVVGILGERCT